MLWTCVRTLSTIICVGDVRLVVAVVAEVGASITKSDTQNGHQVYANKCVLKSGFGDAVHAQDLNKSENEQNSKQLCKNKSGKT